MSISPYKMRYRIGSFIVEMNFDKKQFYQNVHEYMDKTYFSSASFKARNKIKADCYCHFFAHQKNKNKTELHHSYLDGFDFSFSKDFKNINIFLTGPYENSHRYIVNPFCFVPFFLKNNAILAHCSAVSYKGYGFVFIGDADVGKSTIARILAKNGGQIIADETALLHFDNDKYFVSPVWLVSNGCNKVIKQRNPIPLRAVFFLKQGNFSVKGLNFHDKLKKLYRNCYIFLPQLIQEDFYFAARRLFSVTECCQLRYDRSEKIFLLLENLCYNKPIFRR